MDAINSAIVLLNDWGRVCCDFAGRMLLQSSILVGLLLIADLCLRARVSARFRYGMWLLVLVKLVLPPSLALPTGAGYWLGRYLPAPSVLSEASGPVLSPMPGGDVEFFVDVGETLPTTVEAVAESPMASLHRPGLLLLGWIVGALLLLIVVLSRIVSVRRLLARGRPARPQMVALLEECRLDLGVSAPVNLVLTNDVQTPAVCGFLRPVILLPTVLPPGLRPESLRAIFTHELAHIKRRDPWVNLGQTVLQVAYFWHPLVWVANAMLRKLRVGATLDEALAVLGAPARTVGGKPIDWSESKNVLFKDIDGRKGHCYYHRPDQGVRVWFGNYKVAAIYMTRSDYGAASPVTPADAEFAALLQTRVAALNIDTAGPEQIKAIFGEPIAYMWGSQTFQPDALPDRYVMNYPGGFCVFVMGNRIMEIRHERHRGGSPYVYRGVLRIGSTMEEAVALLGAPTETVTGQKNEFKDGVLYRDADGDEGSGYYHRSDQKVRLFFAGGKVIAIYMTRSDFPAGN